MTEERLRHIRNLESLAPLHTHTDAIGINEHGRVTVNLKLPAPVDEHGIPRPKVMVEQLLGQMKTGNYVWTGAFDEHHLATPKSDFTIVRTREEGDIGSAFRGLACLKIMLPRQMHNFSHQLFELAKRPSIEMMRLAITEVGQARQLHEVFENYSPDVKRHMTDRIRLMCVGALQRKLDHMPEPQTGLLPSLEVLQQMELEELRRTVNALLRVHRFSKKHLIHPAIRKKPYAQYGQDSRAA